MAYERKIALIQLELGLIGLFFTLALCVVVYHFWQAAQETTPVGIEEICHEGVTYLRNRYNPTGGTTLQLNPQGKVVPCR